VWDDATSAPLLLPSLQGEVSADVCVVGLGGSGLACIREMQRLGASVVGVDSDRVGGGAGGRNGGFLLAGLAPFHHQAVERFGRARARALYQLTLEEMDRITADGPELVRRPGSLRIAESEAELTDCAVQLTAMLVDGLAVEPYEGTEGRGLLVPGDGVFQPLARCRTVAKAAIADAAMLYERSPVKEIERGFVRTENGAVRSRFVVVAVDGALGQLLPELAARVRTARLQMLATAPTAEIRLARPVYARWGYDYWQQREDGSIAMGGARDIGGDGEWTTEVAVSPAVQDALERRLRGALRVEAPITHRWAAAVGYTEDGLPVVEETRPGVWAIGAYSGTGNVVGSLLGRGVARALLAGDDRIVRAFADARQQSG
jgi:gamma-glutamylputrescine oxidase